MLTTPLAGRVFALVLTIFAVTFPTVASAKHYSDSRLFDNPLLIAWCEKLESAGKLDKHPKRKFHQWRWKFCNELLRNKEPVAVINGPETAVINSYFTLDASGSSDPEGEALSFTWTQVSGTPVVSVNGWNSVAPQFYVATGSAGDDLLFELVVSDGEVSTTGTYSVSVPACGDEAGLLFSDCFTPAWYGLTAWEMLDDGSNYHYENGHNDHLINWQVLDSADPLHAQVIDIRYRDMAGVNGLPRIYSAGGAWSTVNMSDYAGGTVQFDVRVLDWGNAPGLEFKLECIYPCESGALPLQIDTLNEWHHFSIPVDDLAASGLDLANVEIGFQVYPTWGQQSGVHYQLDNIRWSHEPPPQIPDFETFIPAAGNWSVPGWVTTTVDWHAQGDILTFSLGDYVGSETIAFSHRFASATNLVGGEVAGDLVVPAYAQGQSMTVIPYFIDENLLFAQGPGSYINSAEAGTPYGFTFSDIQSEGMVYADEGFALNKVVEYGFYFVVFSDLSASDEPYIFSNLSVTKSNLANDDPGEDPNPGGNEVSLDYANWIVADYSGTTILSSSSTADALHFTPEWNDSFGIFGVTYSLSPSANLHGGSFSVDLFVPQAAVESNAVVTFYFYDTSWNMAARSWIPLADTVGDAWNRFTFDPFESSSNFSVLDPGFNAAEVGYIDIQFNANGSEPGSPGEFAITNVRMIEGSGSGTGGGTGEEPGLIDPQNWYAAYINGAPAIDWIPDANNLSLTPRVIAANDEVLFVNQLDEVVNMNGGAVEALVGIPAALAGKPIIARAFLQDDTLRQAVYSEINLADFSGETYIDWSFAGLGEWNFSSMDDGFNLGAVSAVGIQFIFQDGILDNEAAISVSGIGLIPGTGDGGAGADLILTESLQVDLYTDVGSSWYLEGSELVINPIWFGDSSNGIEVSYTFDNPYELSNGSMSTDIYAPSGYTQTGLGVQLILFDENWEYAISDPFRFMDLNPDAWNTIGVSDLGSVPLASQRENFDAARIQRVLMSFTFALGEVLPNEQIRIRNFTLAKPD